MSDSNTSEEIIKGEVVAEIEQSKAETKNFTAEELKNGDWFKHLLLMVVKSYDRNARAEYFLQKYPGIEKDEVADKLISVATRYAGIAGGVAGAAATADQIAMLGTMGMSWALFVGTIGAEMLYLARLQMRLVLDLAVIYELELDADDPEDVMMVFGYALGVAPADALGKFLQTSTRAATENAIKKYLRKGALKSVQDWGRLIGLKILQRTVIKYAIPAVSMAVGSTYNYMTTKSVGKIAKTQFKNRGAVTEELLDLVTPQITYDLAFAAAVLYMAEVDGTVSPKEKELYESMIQRMTQEEHTPADFRKLMKSEENILAAIGALEDQEVRRNLLNTLILMAVYDGELHEKEEAFLQKAADRLGIPVDRDVLQHKLAEFQADTQPGLWGKAATFAGKATLDAASQTVEITRSLTAKSTEKIKGWRQAFGKGKSDGEAGTPSTL